MVLIRRLFTNVVHGAITAGCSSFLGSVVRSQLPALSLLASTLSSILLLVDALLRPRLEIDTLRELTIIVDLVSLEGRVVVLEALQLDHHSITQLLQIAALVGIDLLVPLLAEVLVLSLKQVWLHIGVERVLQATLVLDVEGEEAERLLRFTNVCILFLKRLNLVANHSTDL